MTLLDSKGNYLADVLEHDDIDGTLMLSTLVGCRLSKSDDVYKMILNFGTTSFEVRVPASEYTEEIKKESFKKMLTDAFALVEHGKKYREEKEAFNSIMAKTE